MVLAGMSPERNETEKRRREDSNLRGSVTPLTA
jgi:hypothetical protein